jgi:valyl-tRNA synthetase
VVDRWIISRLQVAEQEVISALDGFRFDHAAQTLYEFVYAYCDWYLELTKPVLNDDDASADAQRGTRRTLVRVLEAVLRLTHPIMPFITEAIWQRLKPLAGKAGASIMLEKYPTPDSARIDPAAEADVDWIKDVIAKLRNIRGELNVSPGKSVPVLLQAGSREDRERIGRFEAYLRALARVESLSWLAEGEEAPLAAAALVGDMAILVPLKGLVDTDAEVARLTKELDKLTNEVQRLEGKLGNESFVARAPADVVAKEQEKLAEARQAVNQLNEQMQRMKAL